MKQKKTHGKFVLLAVILCSVGQAQALDRGHQTLVDRGLQLQAMIHSPTETGYFDFTRWGDSNFTTVGFSGGTYDTTYLPDPVVPWTRWQYHGGYPADPSDADIVAYAEYPYASSLVNMQVKDEQDITDPTELANLTGAFAAMHSRYPDVIMHVNSSGGQFTSAQLATYMQTAQPDMLMFDHYPFWGTLDVYGLPYWMYDDMKKYRLLGLAGNDGTGTTPIPVGQWTQTWYSAAQPHIVSESEIRLGNFSNWAYGSTFKQSFIYDKNPGLEMYAAMFTGDGTDNPTPQFYYVAETNRQSLNLGPALVRLLTSDTYAPHLIYDPTEGASTGGAPDPYIWDVKVTNPGSIKGGDAGDVIIGYFNPLDASFTNAGHDNDLYFMVVNGLSDRNGSAADCTQEIRLDFDLTAMPSVDSLLRMSRETGQIEEVSLIHDGGPLYHLILTLDGGTGDLFKFHNGGTFVGEDAILISGDVNGDGLVGAVDWNAILQNWGMTGAVRSDGDLNGDYTVGAADYNELMSYWGDTVSLTPPLEPPTVPEPATLAVLLLGGLALLRRRK